MASGLRSARAFMSADVDKVTQRQLLDAAWLVESLRCLLWSLGRVDSIPPYDTQAIPAETWKAVPQGSLTDLLPKATLRDHAEIERVRSLAELWNWRSRTRYLQEQGHFGPGVEVARGMSIESIATERHKALSRLSGLAPGDCWDDTPLETQTDHEATYSFVLPGSRAAVRQDSPRRR